MNTRLTTPWLLAIVLTGAVALPASAGEEAPIVEGPMERANAQVDLAEHALAVARQGLSSPRDGLRLVTARMTRGDQERVAFYQKDVQAARQRLTDLLRVRQAPVQLAAS
jgi:hypothetical protein